MIGNQEEEEGNFIKKDKIEKMVSRLHEIERLETLQQ